MPAHTHNHFETFWWLDILRARLKHPGNECRPKEDGSHGTQGASVNIPYQIFRSLRLKYAYQMRATVYGDFFPVCQKYRHSGPKGKELERYLDPLTVISLWEYNVQLVYSKCISRTFILISLANFTTENFTETHFTRIHTSSLINSEKILNRSGVTF